jgi:hypothetical protein
MKKEMRSDYKLNYELEFSFDNWQKLMFILIKFGKVPKIEIFIYDLLYFFN